MALSDASLTRAAVGEESMDQPTVPLEKVSSATPLHSTPIRAVSPALIAELGSKPHRSTIRPSTSSSEQASSHKAEAC